MAVRKRNPTAALIIAGGRGTRLWPISRARRPKPLCLLHGKQSLLEATLQRVRPLIPAGRIFVLVSAAHAAAFRTALKGILPPGNLIIEPEGRGTTVAIAYGAALIARRLGENTIVAVMPADHLIPDAQPFRETIADALELARQPGALVVVGVTPTRPETGYGYQQIGAVIGAGFKVTRFVEKPSATSARKMIRSGKFLWNGGIFVAAIATLRAELHRLAPGMAVAMEQFGKLNPAQLQAAYQRLTFGSFDRVVAEKSCNLIGVRARFHWDDIGSWEGLWEAVRGQANNVVSGKVVAINSAGILARGGKRLLVLLGVEDLVVIDTDDVIMITRRSRSQEVAGLPDELKRRSLHRYL